MADTADSSRVERPVLVHADMSGVPVRVYSFKGATLALHTLMPPVVLTWLTQNFGQPPQQALWEDCLRRRPLPPLRKVTEPGPLLLDHFEILHVCLLATPPFLDAPHNHVWALLHENPVLKLRCEDWRHLVSALAAALFKYLVSPHTWVLAGDWRAARYQAALDVVKELEFWNSLMRHSRPMRHRLTRAEKGPPVSAQQVSDAVQTLTTSIEQFSFLEGSPTALRAHKDLLRRAERALCAEMVAAFAADGPPYHLRYWSKHAVADTIARILAHLGIEQGELPTIARRILKRLAR